MKKKPSRLLLGIIKATGILPALLFFKPKIHTENNRKKSLKKPCILMSNHQSLLDFVLYLIIFPFNTIRFLMAEILFRRCGIFTWFLYKIGGIKVDRDNYDFNFIEDSLEVLDKGGIVGIFPESRLPVNGKHFPFKAGVALIALRTDAPIIPVYTDGNYGLFKRANIIIGDEIDIREFTLSENPEDEDVERLTQILENKIYDLKRQMESKVKK